MARLNCRTRGMSSPQGKPKVYFTCHPLDFKVYFDRISDEILHCQNCAVWYDEELAAGCEGGSAGTTERPGAMSGADLEQFLSDLGGMQLLVIPVTSRFLYQDCRARTIEFAYAAEHHIPVLPLLQETGLEREFNRVCGDLQFLSRDNCDSTTEGYEEKLKKFLDSVLVDDETAAKVRAAFDAYVFLSYRKKDRKYAKELMRLIHQNDFCRDIAIWYDEYLTPGENFNDAIRDAMEKSRLFALMVTPNLVNEENYVMTVEYPAAVKARKPVLPVEMEATDEAALRENYAGLPECIRPEEGGKLARTLTEHLRDIAVRENDSDPQHLFFISLAYLGGIDVEVDHERALSLIGTAAEAGLDAAMEKLVSMYRTGEGVARDYLTAIRWQERLVEARRRRYGETGSEEDGERLLFGQRRLGDFWYELRRIPEAKLAYEGMGNLADDMVRQGMRQRRRDLFISYAKSGEVCEAEKELAEAKSYYIRSLEICEQINGEAQTPGSRRDLAILYDHLGNISKAEGKLAEAKSYYAKSLELSGQPGEGTGSESRILSVLYHNFGDISRAEGNLQEARHYYEKSLETDRQLCEETGTAESRRDLIFSYNKLGGISRSEGKLSEAKAYYAKCVEIARQLCEETESVEARRDLSVIYGDLGSISRSEGNLSEAKAYYTKALELAEQLNAETGTAQSRSDLAFSYSKLGDINKDEGKFAEAGACYRKALEILEQLSREAGTAEARSDLSACYDGLGDICRAEGNLSEARIFYEKSLEIEEQLSGETGLLGSRRSLFFSYRNLGDISREEGDLTNAWYYYGRGLLIGEQLSEEIGEDEVRLSLLLIYGSLGDLGRREGDLSEAKKYYAKVLEIGERLSKDPGMEEARPAMLVGYSKLGDISLAEGNPGEARRFYEKNLEISEQLSGERGTAEARRDLVVSYTRLGDISKVEGKLAEARTYYAKALDISEGIWEETGTFEARNNLAAAYYYLGNADEDNIDAVALGKALDILKKLRRAAPGNRLVRDRIALIESMLKKSAAKDASPGEKIWTRIAEALIKKKKEKK